MFDEDITVRVVHQPLYRRHELGANRELHSSLSHINIRLCSERLSALYFLVQLRWKSSGILLKLRAETIQSLKTRREILNFDAKISAKGANILKSPLLILAFSVALCFQCFGRVANWVKGSDATSSDEERPCMRRAPDATLPSCSSLRRPWAPARAQKTFTGCQSQQRCYACAAKLNSFSLAFQCRLVPPPSDFCSLLTDLNLLRSSPQSCGWITHKFAYWFIKGEFEV